MPAAVPTIATCSREELAVLVREWLLCGHLIDRSGMPAALGRFGVDGMGRIAITEWMGASPVYTRRTQRLLGFEGGGDVATIFKGMQLDIGAPPQFMDFRYEVRAPDDGEFWLAHCGALMDVEPMGEQLTVTMCHTIEDPTFDATAMATHPRAQVRPVHRPPRHPADRHPHCHWTVRIPADGPERSFPDITTVVLGTEAARLPITAIEADPAGAAPGPGAGRSDYAGDLDPDLDVGDFSGPVLAAISQEVALQGHLLAVAFALAVTEEADDVEAARELLGQQLTGIAGVAAGRVAAARSTTADLEGLAEVLELHPLLHPRAYVDARVEVDADGVLLTIGDCPALHEDLPASWIGLLADGHRRPLEAIAQAACPTARVDAVEPPEGRRLAWRFTDGHPPADEPDEVTLTRFSTGADFTFTPPTR